MAPSVGAIVAAAGTGSRLGRGSKALVRLNGWFKPDLAVAIMRNGGDYTASRLNGKTLVNNVPLNGRRELKNGDVLRVGGLTLEFRLVD